MEKLIPDAGLMGGDGGEGGDLILFVSFKRPVIDINFLRPRLSSRHSRTESFRKYY